VASENPFERYGLDPREGIVAITQRLKELAEDATDDAERERIRAAWEELTLHPARRLRAALHAHPETRAPLGAPPPLPRLRPAAPLDFELRDLAARPSAVAALGAIAKAGDGGGGGGGGGAGGGEVMAPALEDDALF
jgi:hypothetical protein